MYYCERWAKQQRNKIVYTSMFALWLIDFLFEIFFVFLLLCVLKEKHLAQCRCRWNYSSINEWMRPRAVDGKMDFAARNGRFINCSRREFSHFQPIIGKMENKCTFRVLIICDAGKRVLLPRRAFAFEMSFELSWWKFFFQPHYGAAHQKLKN